MSRRADDSEPPIKFVKAGRASRAGQAGHLLADEPSQNHGADIDIPVEADEGILAAVSPEHQSIAKHRYLRSEQVRPGIYWPTSRARIMEQISTSLWKLMKGFLPLSLLSINPSLNIDTSTIPRNGIERPFLPPTNRTRLLVM